MSRNALVIALFAIVLGTGSHRAVVARPTQACPPASSAHVASCPAPRAGDRHSAGIPARPASSASAPRPQARVPHSLPLPDDNLGGRVGRLDGPDAGDGTRFTLDGPAARAIPASATAVSRQAPPRAFEAAGAAAQVQAGSAFGVIAPSPSMDILTRADAPFVARPAPAPGSQSTVPTAELLTVLLASALAILRGRTKVRRRRLPAPRGPVPS